MVTPSTPAKGPGEARQSREHTEVQQGTGERGSTEVVTRHTPDLGEPHQTWNTRGDPKQTAALTETSKRTHATLNAALP